MSVVIRYERPCPTAEQLRAFLTREGWHLAGAGEAPLESLEGEWWRKDNAAMRVEEAGFELQRCVQGMLNRAEGYWDRGPEQLYKDILGGSVIITYTIHGVHSWQRGGAR